MLRAGRGMQGAGRMLRALCATIVVAWIFTAQAFDSLFGDDWHHRQRSHGVGPPKPEERVQHEADKKNRLFARKNRQSREGHHRVIIPRELSSPPTACNRP